jgi:serine/threonine-protein kinase
VARRYEEALGKKIYEKVLPTPSDVTSRPGVIIRKRPEQPDNAPATSINGNPRNAIVQRLQATMLESLAMLKLKGFIHDVGGEIVESVPGKIRVRIGEPVKKETGLLSWFGSQKTTTAPCMINMELQMEKPDPRQPNHLIITLTLTSSARILSADERSKCERISRDLQAYLIGR